MAESGPNNITPENSNRPPLGLLKFLTVLSLISGIVAGLSYLFVGLFSNEVKEIATQTLKEDDELKLILSVIGAGKPFLLSSAVLYLISGTGAYLMFYLHKKGFHLYSISQILLLIVPLVFIKGFPMSFLPVMVTVSFILIYSSYLKWMK